MFFENIVRGEFIFALSTKNKLRNDDKTKSIKINRCLRAFGRYDISTKDKEASVLIEVIITIVMISKKYCVYSKHHSYLSFRKYIALFMLAIAVF